MKRICAFALLFLTLALSAGCDKFSRTPPFKLADLTGAGFGRDFELTDHNGQKRRLADFRGKVVAVFFGFTHCPDVCPTALLELASAAKQLGKDADRLQVLFITVDPQRDTPAVLSKYVPSFAPGFLGLYGDAEATARVAKEFKIFYQKQPGTAPGNYTVDHSAGTYIFDRRGRLRLFAGYGQGAAALVHDIRILLQAS